MTKAEKQAHVQDLVSQLRTLKAAVITEYRGTSVAQMDQLRKQLDDKGITYKVAKNTLLKRALDEVGITVSDPALLDQPIALAMSNDDEVLVAKALTDVNKEMETIVPSGGIVNGAFVNAQVITRLAKLPGREQLYAQLVGGLGSLPTRMVRTIANPMQQLVTGLNQVKAQKEA
jgi:large subunit ribosomal protein L10